MPGIDLRSPFLSRRAMLVGTGLGGAALAAGPLGLASPARAATALEPTRTMRGGANNYRPGAPLVESLGTGFVTGGYVRDAASGRPIAGLRIQIWAATVLGGEPDPVNHGSVLTREDGAFALQMAQIVPNFGQPHAHLAYDDGAYETVFLRPVMASAEQTSVRADFALVRA